MGYISTQPDKLRTALDGLIQLMDRLPMDESFFDAAKDKILRQCRTSKLKEEDRYFVWRTLQRLGLLDDLIDLPAILRFAVYADLRANIHRHSLTSLS